jgi:hypothetical protein
MQKLAIDPTRYQKSATKDIDHALQRIIETLQGAGIFLPEDKKWGATYWRMFLKQISKKKNKTYLELENTIGKHEIIDGQLNSFGLMKEIQTLPAKYPRYGWLRNKLK